MERDTIELVKVVWGCWSMVRSLLWRNDKHAWVFATFYPGEFKHQPKYIVRDIAIREVNVNQFFLNMILPCVFHLCKSCRIYTQFVQIMCVFCKNGTRIRFCDEAWWWSELHDTFRVRNSESLHKICVTCVKTCIFHVYLMVNGQYIISFLWKNKKIL